MMMMLIIMRMMFKTTIATKPTSPAITVLHMHVPQSGGQRVKRSGSSSDQAFSRDESPNRMRHGRGALNRENSRESMLDERRKSRRDQQDDAADRSDSPGRSVQMCVPYLRQAKPGSYKR